MSVFRDLLRSKSFRESQAESLVRQTREVARQAREAREAAEALLARLLREGYETEHRLYRELCERIVRLREIDRFESIGNHARVHCAHGKSWLQSSLNRIEQRLDPNWFFRVSRSDILRLDAIVAIDADVGTGSIATLADGSQVAVSRRQAQVLKQRMGQVF